MNEAFTNIVGYTKEELIGRKARELNLVMEIPDRDGILKQLKERGFVRDIEMIMRSKSGKRSDVLISIDTIQLQDEPYAINVIYDISQRKEAERQP